MRKLLLIYFVILSGFTFGDASTSFFMTILNSLRRNDFTDIQVALNAGANVNQVFLRGGTALHLGTGIENNEDLRKFLQILINAKADINASDSDGNTPLDWAAQDGKTHALKLLIDAKADLDSDNEKGEEVIHHWVENGQIDSLELLIDAKVNIEAPNNNDEKALHYAAKEGNANSLQLLIDAKADIEASDDFENTPLQCAAEMRHADVLQLLIRAKADIEASNDEGMRPVDYAAENEDSHALQSLIRSKADLNLLEGDFSAKTLRTLTSAKALVDTPYAECEEQVPSANRGCSIQ